MIGLMRDSYATITALRLQVIPMHVHESHTMRFGPFVVDVSAQRIFKSGTLVKLPPQPFRLLLFLMQNRGRVVTRDEIQSHLWGAAFVDFDRGINLSINQIRAALVDNSDKPRYVETIPRLGYRFIAEITNGTGVASDLPSPETVQTAAILPLQQQTVASTQPSSHPSGRWQLYAVTLIVLGLVVCAAVLALKFGRSPLGLRNLKILKLTDSGTASVVSISRDGKYVAYVRSVAEKQELRLRQLSSNTEVQVLPPDLGNFVGVTFSPDDSYIYFVRSDPKDVGFRYLFVVPALGGIPRRIATDVDSGAAFSPDGRHIAYEHWIAPRSVSEIKIADPDGANERVLATISHASTLTNGNAGPLWTSDGKTILLPELLLENKPRWAMFAASVDDGSLREILSGSNAFGRPVWVENGKSLVIPRYDPALHRTQLWRASYPDFSFTRLTNDVSDYSLDLSGTQAGDFFVSVIFSLQSQIWEAPTNDLSNAAPLSSGDPALFDLSATRSGEIVALGLGGRLWKLGPTGAPVPFLTSIPEVAAFTRCGTSLVVLSAVRPAALLRIDFDGSSQKELARGYLASPVCSPDGRFVYYVTFDAPQTIWRVSVDGGEPLKIAPILGQSYMGTLVLNSIGTFLAYSYNSYTDSTSTGRHMVVIPATGGSPIHTFDVPGDGWTIQHWRPDGMALDYVRRVNGTSNLWEQPLAGGPPKPLTRFSSGQIFDFSWSPDKSKLLLSKGSVTSDVVLITDER